MLNISIFLLTNSGYFVKIASWRKQLSKYTQREENLLKYLNSKKRLDIKEVVELLHISEATARRLFSELEKEGKLIRTHGGITAIPEGKLDYSFVVSEQKNNAEKYRIGNKAVEFVEEGNVIFLDSGTTVLRLALALKEKFQTGSLKELTVVTNSVVNLEALGASFKLVCVGGDYREKRRDFAGYLAEKAVSNLRFNSCFIGSDGIHPAEGFMTSDVDSARLYEAVIERSDKCYILADADKFGQTSFLSFAPLSKATAIITDSRISGEITGIFKESNIIIV